MGDDDHPSKYVRVYQTWNMLRRTTESSDVSTTHSHSLGGGDGRVSNHSRIGGTVGSSVGGGGGGGSGGGITSTSGARSVDMASFRHAVQMARVERSLSIQELSNRVKCDPDTLSAFERGDDVLSEDLQRSLKYILGLAR